jgi:hypothetical protein
LIKLNILLSNGKNISFVQKKDYTKDVVVMSEIYKINPLYNQQVKDIKSYASQSRQYVQETRQPISTLPNVPRPSDENIADITKELNLDANEYNLPVFSEGLNSTLAITRLTQRFDKNYQLFMSLEEYQDMKYSIFKRNISKPEAYKQSYMDYDYAMIAFQRYQKVFNRHFERTLREAGYAGQKDFEDQMTLMWHVNTQIEKKKAQEYPNIDDVVWYLVTYQKEIFELTKTYWFSDEKKRQESEKVYIAYQKEADILVKTWGYEEKIKGLQEPNITTGADVQKYLEDLNSVSVYNTELEALKKKYGKEKIETYGKYITAVNTVTQKYGKENLELRSSQAQSYQNMVKDVQKAFGPEGMWVPGMGKIDREKYEKFSELYQQERLAWYNMTVTALQKILYDPSGQNSPFPWIKAHADIQKKQQSETDLYRATRKNKDIVGYTIANVLSSARNGFMDFTRGAGSSIGVLLASPFIDDDRMASLLYSKQQFDQACSFNLSSQMKTPPIDENGNRNLGFDNTVSLVSSQVVNMLMLISWAWAISEGIALGGAKAGVMISANIAGKVWLFSMAMIQQTGRSFVEAKDQWLSDDQAFEYAMLQSVVSSALELISPNNLISGQGKNTLKMIMKWLLKEGTEKELKTVGKLVLKDLWKEVIEENLQETLQLAVGNGINMWINSEWWTEFDETLTLDNFTTTMLLTTLTTGIASTPWMIRNAHSWGGWFTDIQKLEIKQSIIQNPLLYTGMISQINVLLGSENGFQDFSKQDLMDLKKDLETMYGEYVVDKSDVPNVTGVSPEIVKANAVLDDDARIAKAEELLWWVSLHPEMQEAIIAAHNQDGTIFNLTYTQIRARVEILNKAGFNSKQIKILIKNGICGQAEAMVLDANKDGVFDESDVKVIWLENIFVVDGKNLLDQIKSPEVKQEMLNIMQENIDTWMLDIENGKAYIEANGQKVESELFNEMKNYSKEQAIFTWLQVRTENFKNRFGDWQWNPLNASKVVDKNGEPLVVYHWSSRSFDQFKYNAPKQYWAFSNTKWVFYFGSNFEGIESNYAQIKVNFMAELFRNIFNGDISERNNFFESIWTDKIKLFDAIQKREWVNKYYTIEETIKMIWSNELDIWNMVIEYKTLAWNVWLVNADEVLGLIDYDVNNFKKNFEKIDLNGGDWTSLGEWYYPKNAWWYMYPSFLNIKNPATTTIVGDGFDNWFNMLLKEKTDINDWMSVFWKNVTEKWIFAAFNPNQIKSATNNDGYFNDVSSKFRWETKSTVDPEIVKANAALEDWPRLQKAEELLPSRKQTLVDENGKPTVLWEKVLNAHNNSKGGEIYNITPEQLREKVQILNEAGFTSEEIRILIENGICGQVEVTTLDVNKDGVFDSRDD